jgi:hypothetical protein
MASSQGAISTASVSERSFRPGIRSLTLAVLKRAGPDYAEVGTPNRTALRVRAGEANREGRTMTADGGGWQSDRNICSNSRAGPARRPRLEVGMVIRIAIDTTVPLAGTVATEQRPPVPFVGWLEMLRAISGLLDEEESQREQVQTAASSEPTTA